MIGWSLPVAVPPFAADPRIGLEPTQDYAPSPSTTGPGPRGHAATLVEGPQGPLSLIGQSVGQYRVVKELGRGGMGIVYLAEHIEIGQRAALKTLHPEITANPQFKRRFLNAMGREESPSKNPGCCCSGEWAGKGTPSCLAPFYRNLQPGTFRH